MPTRKDTPTPKNELNLPNRGSDVTTNGAKVNGHLPNPLDSGSALKTPSRGEMQLALGEPVQSSTRITLLLNPETSRPKTVLCLSTNPHLGFSVNAKAELTIAEEIIILKAIAANASAIVAAFSTQLKDPGVKTRMEHRARYAALGASSSVQQQTLLAAKRAAFEAIIAEIP